MVDVAEEAVHQDLTAVALPTVDILASDPRGMMPLVWIFLAFCVVFAGILVWLVILLLRLSRERPPRFANRDVDGPGKAGF